MPSPDIQQRQHDQYIYPYHHIPYIDSKGIGRRVRFLDWGFEYLLYNERVVEILKSMNLKSILDVGCGDGYLLGQIADIDIVKIGVDINGRAIQFAKAFFPTVDYRSSDVSEVTGTFDAVCAVEVIEHIPDAMVSPFLQLIAARVRPSGALVISVPTTNEPLNSKHFRHYDLSLLENHISILAPRFSLEHFEFYYQKTLIERIYRALTNNKIVQGESPLLRRFVWPYVKRKAAEAESSTGLHLIAVLRSS